MKAGVPAFPDIFERYTPMLWRALMNMGVPAHDAQDLCQEVMITVHRRLDDFDGRSLRGWLYGICVRVASDYRRSARVRREIVTDAMPDDGVAADQPEQVDRRRQMSRLSAALERLDEDKRTAFVLYEVEELTLSEIAVAVDAPLQTVYSRVKSARELIQKSFREPQGSPARAQGGIREAG